MNWYIDISLGKDYFSTHCGRRNFPRDHIWLNGPLNTRIDSTHLFYFNWNLHGKKCSKYPLVPVGRQIFLPDKGLKISLIELLMKRVRHHLSQQNQRILPSLPLFQQECISVGCVPYAAVTISGGGGDLPRGSAQEWWCLPMGCLTSGGVYLWVCTPPICGQNNRCFWNITFLQILLQAVKNFSLQQSTHSFMVVFWMESANLIY